MKPKRAIILLAWFMVFSMPEVKISRPAFRTPELFGDALALIAEGNHTLYGLIYNKDFAGVITGTVDGNEITCQIRQIAGSAIQDAQGHVVCFAMRRGDRWVGWIDFRGHHRKFCGASEISRLPASCHLRTRGHVTRLGSPQVQPNRYARPAEGSQAVVPG